MAQMEHKLAQDGTGVEGNTSTSTPRKKYRKYCFTLNNYTDLDIITIKEKIEKGQYIIGKEVGTNNTPHLQGYVEFKNAIAFNAMKNIMPKAHIEKANGNKMSNFIYCSKDGNYITNITDIKIPKKVKDPLEGKELYDFQKRIIDIVNNEPNDRIIYWFWEKTGNAGKTALCKHLCLTKNCLILNGKQNDMFCAILTYKESTGDFPEIIICDIPRSSIDYISWGAIEKIKDGLFYSGKYEGGMVVMNPPHVICMANEPPDLTKLSMDRWAIEKINENKNEDE